MNYSIGNCITGIESAEVCELGSMSTGCSQINTTATTDCMCNHGVNATNCQGIVTVFQLRETKWCLMLTQIFPINLQH